MRRKSDLHYTLIRYGKTPKSSDIRSKHYFIGVRTSLVGSVKYVFRSNSSVGGSHHILGINTLLRSLNAS